jgi:hypothetical protein
MQKKTVRLRLNRETVRELNSEELGLVVGAKPQTIALDCFSGLPTQCGCTGVYPSINQPCLRSADIC